MWSLHILRQVCSPTLRRADDKMDCAKIPEDLRLVGRVRVPSSGSARSLRWEPKEDRGRTLRPWSVMCSRPEQSVRHS